MYCTKCGKRLDDGALVCANCGKPVPKELLALSTPALEDQPETPAGRANDDAAVEPASSDKTSSQPAGSEEPESIPNVQPTETSEAAMDEMASGPACAADEPSPEPEAQEPPPLPVDVEPPSLLPSPGVGRAAPLIEAPRRLGCGWAMMAGMLAGCALMLVVGLALLGVYQGTQERNRLNRAAALEHYRKGLDQFSSQNYELARAEFELTLQLDPNNGEAAAKLTEVNAVLSRRPTPTSALRHQTAVVLYNEARALYSSADWEGMIAKLEQVQALEPAYEVEQVNALLVEAYYKAGLKLRDEDRMEEAVRYFDRALTLDPADVEIRDQKRLAALYIAGLGYWKANWQGAVDSFTVLYQQRPDYKDTKQRLHDAYVAYGDQFSEQRDWCAARDRYETALTIQVSDATMAKRDSAAVYCSAAPATSGTPPPKGTYVGSLVRIEDVGSQTSMMIRGTIYDATGEPMPGVSVGLSAFDWSASPAETNESGVFAFDGLGNPVVYTISLPDLAYVPFSIKGEWSKLIWVEFRAQP